MWSDLVFSYGCYVCDIVLYMLEFYILIAALVFIYILKLIMNCLIIQHQVFLTLQTSGVYSLCLYPLFLKEPKREGRGVLHFIKKKRDRLVYKEN